MDIPENFDINILRILQDSFGNTWKKSKDRIGISSISGGARKLVLERMYSIQTEPNPKMLLGTIMHNILQQPTILSGIIHEINKRLEIDELQQIITESKLSYEVRPGKFLKGLVDIETPQYGVEIKTTHAYVKEYVRQISYGNMIQLNSYLGIRGLKLGFLLVINMRCFTAKFNGWNELWQKYCFILPFQFDQELFDNTILKAETIFDHIDKNDPKLPCPEQDWECNYCSVINYCGKVEIGCTHRDPKTHKLCSKKMHEWIECLTDEFKEDPICENCYTTKTSKRKLYSDVKYLVNYPWELKK